MGTLRELKCFILDFMPMSLGVSSLKITVITREVWRGLVFHGPKWLLGLVNCYEPSIKWGSLGSFVTLLQTSFLVLHRVLLFKYAFVLCIRVLWPVALATLKG